MDRREAYGQTEVANLPSPKGRDVFPCDYRKRESAWGCELSGPARDDAKRPHENELPAEKLNGPCHTESEDPQSSHFESLEFNQFLKHRRLGPSSAQLHWKRRWSRAYPFQTTVQTSPVCVGALFTPATE
jgi:hypothetical protein